MFSDKSRYYLIKNQALPNYFSDKVAPEMQTLGDLIRERMHALGINSNSELATRIGKSDSYVGDLINNTGKTKSGYYKPSPELVSKLSEHLHVSQAKILNCVGFNIPDDSSLDDDQQLLLSICKNLEMRDKTLLINIAKAFLNIPKTIELDIKEPIDEKDEGTPIPDYAGTRYRELWDDGNEKDKVEIIRKTS